MKIKRTLPALAFLAIAFYILLGFQDMIYTAHLRTPFIAGQQFWQQLSGEPFGAMRWAGCWLTQLAYFPLLATVVYLALWGLGYWLLDRTLRLPARWSALQMLPFACMLLGVTAVGYWLYVQKDWGFWFSQSLALTLMLALMWCAQRLMKGAVAAAVVAVVATMLYPVLGWYMPLMALCLLALNVRRGWAALPLLITLLSGGLWKSAFPRVSAEAMWLGGFPTFVDAQKFALRPSAPFIALGVSLLVLAALKGLGCLEGKETEGERKAGKGCWLVTAVTAVVALVCVKLFCFADYNYQAEMRMNREVMAENWREVLKEFQKAEKPSRSMVLLKNLALAHTGQLGERGFKLTSTGEEICNPDSIQLSSMHIVAPTVYLNYGRLNYSIRWCIEMAVGYGYSPYFLQTMISAAKATGEEHLVEKYQKLLHGHLFYADWQPKPTTPFIASLAQTYANVLDSDHNNIERYLIELFAGSYVTDNDIVRDLCLFHAMLYRDPNFFWNALMCYLQANAGKPLPVHYQEAYLSHMNLYPVELPVKVKIDPQVEMAFKTFLSQYGNLFKAGKSQDEVGAEMKDRWGGTYFWHIMFGRNTY